MQATEVAEVIEVNVVVVTEVAEVIEVNVVVVTEEDSETTEKEEIVEETQQLAKVIKTTQMKSPKLKNKKKDRLRMKTL